MCLFICGTLAAVFPARAGVIRIGGRGRMRPEGFPRTRGGDPYPPVTYTSKEVFSPHARA